MQQGATRFRRKLSRLEGMPGATCPQSGGKLELPTHSWLWLPSLNWASYVSPGFAYGPGKKRHTVGWPSSLGPGRDGENQSD